MSIDDNDDGQFFPSAQNKPKKLTKKQQREVKASAKRSIALGIMPALVNAHPDLTPLKLVRRAYGIAEQMLIQGDNL